MCEEINDNLHEVGQMDVAELSKHFSLPNDFLLEVRILSIFKDIVRGDIFPILLLYSLVYINRTYSFTSTLKLIFYDTYKLQVHLQINMSLLLWLYYLSKSPLHITFKVNEKIWNGYNAKKKFEFD